MQEVASASKLLFVDGSATRVAASGSGALQLTVRRGDGAIVDLKPDLLVDASGFDDWWFLDLVEGFERRWRDHDDYLTSLRDNMHPDLSFSRPWRFPRLHAPAHSSALGAGYGSLMSLGGMSDLILCGYAGLPTLVA